MITYICLTWLGFKLSAPTWYFVLLGVGSFIKLIKYGVEMYKAGSKN